MSLKSPDEWLMLTYYSGQIVQEIAQQIADQAVALNEIDKRVVSVYQDACAVDAMLRALHSDANNNAMAELVGR